MNKDTKNNLFSHLNYSSSSDSETEMNDNETDEPPPEKEQKLVHKFPVPIDLLNSVILARTVDKPTDHGGRVRSFPHKRNSWATHIFVPVKNNLTELQFALEEELRKIGISIEAISEPHMSLSKTLAIPNHWIDPLVETLNKNLSQLKRLSVKFSTVEIFCNEEKTRTFIAVGANSCKSTLMSVINIIDKSAAEFKLPKYYEEPNFHASIAWCLEDCTAILSSVQNKLDSLFNSFKIDSGDDCVISVTHIHMKCGNKLFSFPLS